MRFNLIGFIILLIFGLSLIITITTNTSHFVNYIAPYAPKSQEKWWNRSGWERFGYPSYSYWENFENINDKPDKVSLQHKITNEDTVMDYPPNSPSVANIYNNTPYHLLSDELSPPRTTESLSCVNSRSCYATDFERMISKTGNYRQMTNNYKRGYPDSCSAPYQELVLNFYKADSIPL